MPVQCCDGLASDLPQRRISHFSGPGSLAKGLVFSVFGVRADPGEAKTVCAGSFYEVCAKTQVFVLATQMSRPQKYKTL